MISMEAEAIACQSVLRKQKVVIQENLILAPEILDYLESKEMLTTTEIQRIQVSASYIYLFKFGCFGYNCLGSHTCWNRTDKY